MTRARAPKDGGIPCPTCGAAAALLRTHLHHPTASRWRRHRCPSGHRFSTVQVIATAPKGLWHSFMRHEGQRRRALATMVPA